MVPNMSVARYFLSFDGGVAAGGVFPAGGWSGSAPGAFAFGPVAFWVQSGGLGWELSLLSAMLFSLRCVAPRGGRSGSAPAASAFGPFASWNHSGLPGCGFSLLSAIFRLRVIGRFWLWAGILRGRLERIRA